MCYFNQKWAFLCVFGVILVKIGVFVKVYFCLCVILAEKGCFCLFPVWFWSKMGVFVIVCFLCDFSRKCVFM